MPCEVIHCCCLLPGFLGICSPGLAALLLVATRGALVPGDARPTLAAHRLCRGPWPQVYEASGRLVTVNQTKEPFSMAAGATYEKYLATDFGEDKQVGAGLLVGCCGRSLWAVGILGCAAGPAGSSVQAAWLHHAAAGSLLRPCCCAVAPHCMQ